MKQLNSKDNFTKLYQYLQLGSKHTSQELSEKFSLSLRTVQLFLKELREHHGLKKEKKYYYFDDVHRKIDQNQRVEMSTALMLALYKCAFPKLHNEVKENFKNIPKEIEAFLFDLNFQEIENEVYFNQITYAIINRLALNFHYSNTMGKASIKNVFPLKVTNVLDYWYMMGYDLEADKVKTYYINNIEKLSIFDESYLNETKVQELTKLSISMLSPWFNDEQKSVALKVTGDARLYLKRKQTEAFKIEEEHEDFLSIRMFYYNDIEILNFVKKWIPFISIVDDEQLKQKLQKMLQEYLLVL